MPFHDHFADKHDGISDWEITLIDQTDSIDILGEESLFGSMDSTHSSQMDIMSGICHSFDVFI